MNQILRKAMHRRSGISWKMVIWGEWESVLSHVVGYRKIFRRCIERDQKVQGCGYGKYDGKHVDMKHAQFIKAD